MLCKKTMPLIEEAAAKEESRYAITTPYLHRIGDDVTRGELTATNGRILAVVPVELEAEDEPGPVPVAALKAGRKHAKVSIPTAVRCLHKEAGNQAEVHSQTAGGLVASFVRGDGDGRFPDYKNVTWDPAKAKKDGDEVLELGINAEYLYRLARAICAGKRGLGVVLRIKVDTVNSKRVIDAHPIMVEPTSPVDGDGYGAIMPITVG